MNLNLNAVWSGAQVAARIMQGHGGGTIVNISSSAAGNASPFNGPYAVAKTGVNSLTQTLASELAPFDIRVNGVSPGPIPTEVFMEFLKLKPEDIPELGKRFQIPLGRVGTPKDIAPAVQTGGWLRGPAHERCGPGAGQASSVNTRPKD